jgi:hypothetical protein
MAFADPQLADECLNLLTVTPPENRRSHYAAEAAMILAETRRMFGDIRAETQEYIDLYRHGRV